MYIKAKFYKSNMGAYAGQEYIFKTNLNVVNGSLVILPGSGGTEHKGIVTETYVSESEINTSWADRIQEVIKFDE